MTTYNIYLPPLGHSSDEEVAAKFLPDGKSWFAGFLPPFWLLINCLWWALGMYFAFAIIILLALSINWAITAILISAIPGTYLFLEGHELIRQKYEARNWRHVATIHAQNIKEAELRYFFDAGDDMTDHEFTSNHNDNKSGQNTSATKFGPVYSPLHHNSPSKAKKSDMLALFPLDETP